MERWYDHWLKGAGNGVPDDALVRLFLMGANRWIEPTTWPPSEAIEQRWYVRADGGLSRDVPPTDEPTASYTHDPDDPAPALLGPPVDLGPLDRFGLTYTSEPLPRDLTVVGPLRLVLHASSSAPDTDWIVRLADVWPDGRAYPVCTLGVLRARYRDGFERAALMEPGRPYRFEIDMHATAQLFTAGHRLRIYVVSSAFPYLEPNLGTGGDAAEETVGHPARNTVHHDAARASYVVLPVLP